MQQISFNIYNEITQEICRLNCRTVVPSLQAKFSNTINKKTLECILAQDYQRKMKRTHVQHHQPVVMQSYYERYLEEAKLKQSPGFLTRIADEVDLSPSLMAKLILEQYLSSRNEKPPTKQQVSSMMKDTTLIDCPVLSVEINMCHIHDEQYGPLIDAVKQLKLYNKYKG